MQKLAVDRRSKGLGQCPGKNNIIIIIIIIIIIRVKTTPHPIMCG